MSTCRRCTCGLGRYFVVQECGVKRKEKTGARKTSLFFKATERKQCLIRILERISDAFVRDV